jgi:hypothetical protein
VTIASLAAAIAALLPGEEVAACDHLDHILRASDGIGLPTSVAVTADRKVLVGNGRHWEIWDDRWNPKDAARLAAWVAAELTLITGDVTKLSGNIDDCEVTEMTKVSDLIID